MISKYVGIAYLALQVVAWFMARADKAEQAKLTKMALDAIRMKLEDEVIASAAEAYNAALQRAAADPDSLRRPDKYSRT